MTTSISAGTITWASSGYGPANAYGELKYQFVSCGINATIAGYMESFIKMFTGATSGHAGFNWLDRDAKLIIALQNFTRPLVDVAKACWGTYGTRGSTPATVAQVKSYINKAITSSDWKQDNNDRQERNDLTNIATLIADTIHSYLGDAGTGDFTGSGPMIPSALYVAGTLTVFTKDQYAVEVARVMGQIIRGVRAFATSPVAYPQYLSNNYPDYQYWPLLDESEDI